MSRCLAFILTAAQAAVLIRFSRQNARHVPNTIEDRTNVDGSGKAPSISMLSIRIPRMIACATFAIEAMEIEFEIVPGEFRRMRTP